MLAKKARRGIWDKQIEFVDKISGKEGSVDRGSAFEQKFADAEFLLQHIERCGQVDIC